MPEGRPSDVAFPAHVYVPGRTARHPEGWFDGIRSSATEVAPEQLHRTEAFRTGLAYLRAGFNWECHEVLEAVWMRTPDPSPEREMTQALIQLANARLKIRMERRNAALRLCGMVEEHLSRCPRDSPVLGLRPRQVERMLSLTKKAAKNAS